MTTQHNPASHGDDSTLHRLPPAVKLSAAVALIAAISLLPHHYAPYLALPAVLVVFLAALAGVNGWAFIKRILLLEPFVLGVALLALFSPAGGAGALGGGADTWQARGLAFAFLLTRCTLALAVMVLFTTTTPFADILRVFRQARVPALLVTTLALMHRYLAVLGDEAARMRRARECRTFLPRRHIAWWMGATVIGQLFLRASERADRIYDAMCSRGWRP
jgi:cobalt/nickel transport system permease protein